MKGAASEGPPALQALLRLRAQICRRCELELGAAAAAVRRAEEALGEADRRRKAHRTSLQAARQRLPAAGTRAGQHQREQDWQGRLALELERLEAAWRAAQSHLEEQRGRQASARQALHRALADKEAAERAWQAWDQARRAAEQRRAEEELADLMATRRSPPAR